MSDTNNNPWMTKPATPDLDATSETWRRLINNAVGASFATVDRMRAGQVPAAYDPTAPIRSLVDFNIGLMSSPATLANAQMKAVNDWSGFFYNQTRRAAGLEVEAAITPERSDRRFSDPSWQDDPFFSALKEAYLLSARSMVDLVAENQGVDEGTRTRVDFYMRQFLNAVAPTNFANSNPTVVRKTIESQGLNLLGGLANLLEDYAAPDAWVSRRQGDAFEIGKDIAATPGAVVFQNELMQLIQYTPATQDVYKRPMLYVPPLVNKYYLMDLRPESSLFKWLIDQGHTVFAISWINPGPELQDKGFGDYVLEGPIAALDAIEQATGERQVDLFSFCMGGALAAASLSYLQETGEADRVASATMMAMMIDNGDLGEWSTFVEGSQIDAFNAHIEAKGIVAGDDLKKLFSVVRANDLIWSSVVDHYLLDRAAPASDLMHWFADGANMTRAFLATWSQDVLQENKLCVPGGLKVGDVAIDLSKVKTPIFNLALKDDHVAGWQAVYRNGAHFGGPVRFVLGGSGHNAGIINPPSRNKHGFWLNDQNSDKDIVADAWLDGAEKNEGSWWPTWQDWLTSDTLEQERVSARIPGGGDLKVLEVAPGSYMRG